MTVRNRPYQRRRRGPVLLVLTVLAVVAAVTWTTVLIKTGAATGAAACPLPTAGPPPGEVLPASALANVPPVPPSTVKVRVLNAGSQRGQANLVAAQLGDLGFVQAAPPTNDKFFPDGDMTCMGQLRFGKAGQGAASTVALLVPCAELVRDARGDDTVDVAVGTGFPDINPGRAGGTHSTSSARPTPGRPAPATPTPPRATLHRLRHRSLIRDARRGPRGDLRLRPGPSGSVPRL